MSVRLFNVETTDEHDLEDALSEDGRRVAFEIREAVARLVDSVASQGVNLRDAEVLAADSLHLEFARAIIMRRRKERDS